MKKNMTTVVCALLLIFAISTVPAFADITGSSLTAVTKYAAGETNTIVYRCDAVTPDTEYMYTVVVNYLAGMNVITGELATGEVNGGTFSYNGAVGDAAIARWDSDENLGVSYGSLINGESGYFTNKVVFSPSLSNDQILTYYLFGDGYASAPHALTNTLTLQEWEWSPNVRFTPDSYSSSKSYVSVTLLNDTGAAGDFNLSYLKGVSSGWEVSGPASITGIANGDTSTFFVEVLITNDYFMETQTSTVVAVSASDSSITGTATIISASVDNVVELPVEVETGMSANLGVEYDGTSFWVTSRGDSTTSNLLSKLDATGNLVTQFLQATSSTWGWRDMAWDGNYLYASDSTDVDIIDPTTGLTNGSFTGPQNPNRALAYNPSNDHFWTANFASDIYEFDRSGTVITQFPNAYGIYGMAWDDKTPGGPFLLVWAGGNPPICAQFDPNLGVYTGISFEGVTPPGGIPGGATFANFNGKDTFFAMHQATPDTIVGYAKNEYETPPVAMTTNNYGWEDFGTILGQYGNVSNPVNVVSGFDPNWPGTVTPRTGNRMLQLTEQPLGGTPNAYIGWVTNLVDGDEVTASFYGWDSTTGTYPRMRVWGHYATSDDINNYKGSAGGNDTYTTGTGVWDQVSYTWTFDSDSSTRDALVIEARLYSGTAGDTYWVDDEQIIAPDTATAIFPVPEPGFFLILVAGLLFLIKKIK